jgi:uncharacterized protein YdeI (YjbR/CyaY-like superfamily)
MKPRFFAKPADFRRWLERNHDKSAELWVGFYKKGSGKPSITWPEAVDQALCFGWIDGLRKSVDDDSYMIRFTPRTARSTWSAVNIKRAKELIGEGLMQPAGLKAFEARADDRSAIYSYEQRKTAELDSAQTKQFQKNRKAWEFFQAQPPGYRRSAAHWVVSAKQEETRARRLSQLIEDSERGKAIGPLRRPTKSR